MSMAEIRRQRGVPAKRGMRVIYRENGQLGTITSACRGSGYLMILLDGEKVSRAYHPTWKLDYLDEAGATIFRSPE